MSQQLNSNNNTGMDTFPGLSFIDLFAHFLANVKSETKDIFELLNYPCVYQNPRKRISINDIPVLRKNYSLNIISKKDKIHVEKFVEKKKELLHILENVRNYNKIYKLNTSIVSILENMIMLHLFNEFKIQNIISTLREHNFTTPMLNSDLPDTLIPHIELQEEGEQFSSVETPRSLSINDHKLMYILKYGNVNVRVSNLDRRKRETTFTNAATDPNIENSNTSDSSLLNFSHPKEDIPEVHMELEKGYNDVEINKEVERARIVEKETEIEKKREAEKQRERTRLLAMYLDQERKNDRERDTFDRKKRESFDKNAKEEDEMKAKEAALITESLEFEREAIADIGLSPETLLLLNLLPKRRKRDDISIEDNQINDR